MYGQASFSTISAFEQGQVSKYTIVPGPTELGWRSLFSAGFIEDAWKATPRLELRAGLRVESSTGWNEAQGRAANYDFTDRVINTAPTIGASALSDNRAKFMPEPRVAFAWDILGNGKTAVKGSFGRRLSVTGPLQSAQLGGVGTMFEFSRFLFPSLATATEPPGRMLDAGLYAWADEERKDLLAARYAELFRHLAADSTEIGAYS